MDKANYEELPQAVLAQRLVEHRQHGLVVEPIPLESYHVRC